MILIEYIYVKKESIGKNMQFPTWNYTIKGMEQIHR